MWNLQVCLHFMPRHINQLPLLHKNGGKIANVLQKSERYFIESVVTKNKQLPTYKEN
jgi:hypothetical protein